MARKMKDSGIEWIGEIPEGWSVSKVLHCLSMPITDGPHTTPILYDTGIPFVSAEAVSCGNGRIDFSHIRGYISEQFYKECCQKYVPEIDDIYMIKSGATTGRVAIVDTTRVFTIWSPLAVFRCNKDCMLPKFLYYYLQSPAFQKEVEFGWTFGTQQNVGMRSLEQMKVCVPQLNKQDTIANYLDYQCTQIDLLLQKALTSIEEYKKLKQAVITQAVTKGVRGEREMKDSGVEWIGEIPTAWDVAKAKYCVTITHGSDPKTEGSIPVYGSGAESFKTCGEYKEGPAVLIGRKGATLHIPHYIEGKYWNVDTAFDVKAQNNFSLPYYYYLATSFDYKFYISQTTLPGMTQGNYYNMFLPFPAFPEQKEIVAYLDAKCAEIDKLIAKKEQLAKELESYKKSLIYEVVTGKREV